MKSIKRGRGPSLMGGFANILAIFIGIFWTVLASSIAPFMAIFGIIFILIAVINMIYNFKNATSENRYSEYDIVDEHEERDPLDQRFNPTKNTNISSSDEIKHFCPYCGTKVDDSYEYCPKCGKKI